MNEIIQGISQQVGQYLPSIASAIGVLIIGWIVAHIIARIVRLALSKTGVDDKLSKVLGAKQETDLSRVIGKIVFYLVMLFVFVTFFNVLDLPIVSEPMSNFLDKIFTFAPQAISAIVLGVVAWALATVGRIASRTALEAVDIDGRLASLGNDASAVVDTATAATDRALNSGSEVVEEIAMDLDDGEIDLTEGDDFSSTPANLVQSEATGDEVKLSQTLPEALYWVILFLFLPAILGALKVPGLLEPIQAMFEKAFAYMPNLIGAAIILVVGFLVAKIVRQVVSNLASSFGVDRLGSKLGLMSQEGGTKLSGIIGVIAYATVLLPILVAALDTLDIAAITTPAGAVLDRITAAIPGLIGGGVVLAISFFVAKLVSGVVVELLSGVGFDKVPTKLGITKEMKTPPSSLAGKALMVLVMLLATMQALPMMGLSSFAGQLEQFFEFGVQVLLGLVIIGLGFYLANLAASFVKQTGVGGADKLALVARIAIVILASGMGLERMGLSTSIVNVAFGSLLGGLGLAAAIAFGWGGRDAAKRLLDRYVG